MNALIIWIRANIDHDKISTETLFNVTVEYIKFMMKDEVNELLWMTSQKVLTIAQHIHLSEDFRKSTQTHQWIMKVIN